MMTWISKCDEEPVWGFYYNFVLRQHKSFLPPGPNGGKLRVCFWNYSALSICIRVDQAAAFGKKR